MDWEQGISRWKRKSDVLTEELEGEFRGEFENDWRIKNQWGQVIPTFEQPTPAGQLGALGTGIDWWKYPIVGAEQAFTMLGSIATRGFGARAIPEMEYGLYDPRRLGTHLPGGIEYKAYQEWEEKQKPFINMPQWMGLLGEILEISPAEVYEMAPLVFIGGGVAKKPLEKVVDVTLKQIGKGKSAEEAINIASQQAVKRGWVKPPSRPLVKPPVPPEVLPKPVEPVVEAGKGTRWVFDAKQFRMVPKAVEVKPTKVALPEPIRLQTEMPYLNPTLSPRQVRKQSNIVAKELVEDLGGIPKRPPPLITRETMQKGFVPRVTEKFSGFVNRTYRVERMLEKLDKYKGTGKYGTLGGKFKQAIWKPINDATDKKIAGVVGKAEEFRGILKTNNIRLHDVLSKKVDTDGLLLTPSERIGIYLHSLNPENLVHVVFGNGIDSRIVGRMKQLLTPEEKVIADWFYKFYQEGTPIMAEATKQVGKKFKPVENYFPLSLHRGAISKYPEMDFSRVLIDESKYRYAARYASSRIKKGFILPRTGKAMNPVEIDSVGVFMKHLEGIEHYKAFAPAIRDVQMLLNNPSLRSAITEKEGKAVYDVLSQWVKDVAWTNPLRVTSQSEAILRRLRVNAVTAVLGFNITTALKQFPSFITGMAEVGELPAMRGLFTSMLHPKQTRQLIKQYSPQIHKRVFERELAEAQALRSLEKTVEGKFSPREIFMVMTTTMDRLAVNGLWRGGFDDAIKRGMGEKEAAKWAEQAIRKTQPFFSVKDVPEYWRSGEFMRALTIFTNQLNQYWNYYVFDIVGKARAGVISKPDVIRKVMEAFVVPALMIGAISRSKPAQNTRELGEDLTSMAMATIPIVGSFMTSGIKGFHQNQGLITTELLGKIQEVSYQLNKGDWDKAIQTIPELAGYVAGVPVAQPKRTTQAIIDIAEGKSDDWMQLIWGKWVREKLEERPSKGYRKKETFKKK